MTHFKKLVSKEYFTSTEVAPMKVLLKQLLSPRCY